jgi:hypothetical protein
LNIVHPHANSEAGDGNDGGENAPKNDENPEGKPGVIVCSVNHCCSCLRKTATPEDRVATAQFFRLLKYFELSVTCDDNLKALWQAGDFTKRNCRRMA